MPRAAAKLREEDDMRPDAVATEPKMDKRVRVISSEAAAKCNLPPFPMVATRAMKLVADPDSSMDAIAKVVATDATLAARVLKISRTATYARREPPETLERAIVTLGLGTLKWVLTCASVRSVFPQARTPFIKRLHGRSFQFPKDFAADHPS